MIRNIRGMIGTVSGTSDRVQAGSRHKFARSERRPPEPCAVSTGGVGRIVPCTLRTGRSERLDPQDRLSTNKRLIGVRRAPDTNDNVECRITATVIDIQSDA